MTPFEMLFFIRLLQSGRSYAAGPGDRACSSTWAKRFPIVHPGPVGLKGTKRAGPGPTVPLLLLRPAILQAGFLLHQYASGEQRSYAPGPGLETRKAAPDGFPGIVHLGAVPNGEALFMLTCGGTGLPRVPRRPAGALVGRRPAGALVGRCLAWLCAFCGPLPPPLEPLLVAESGRR